MKEKKEPTEVKVEKMTREQMARLSVQQRLARRLTLKEYIEKDKFSEIAQIALVKKKISKKECAELMDTSHSNLTTKLARNNWTESDMRLFADKLGYDLEIKLVDRQTGEKF